MKFIILTEDAILPETDLEKEVHLYGNSKDGFFIYDGSKLVKISLGQASKIIRDSEDSKRELSHESEEARKKRLLKIKKDLNSDDLKGKAEWEAEKKKKYDFKSSDFIGDKPKDLPKSSNSKLEQLKSDIKYFIASQIGIDLGTGYGKPNPFSVDRSIMLKSRKHVHSTKIPSVAVYFDRSGSWNSPAKTQLGWDAISVLNEFEKNNLITVTVYYFAVHVFKDEDKALAEVNNSGEPIIQHMIQSNVDNIIIMTDSHVIYPDDGLRWQPDRKDTYPKSICRIPGAAIGIFYGCSESAAKETMKHIQGNLATKYYLFYRGED